MLNDDLEIIMQQAEEIKKLIWEIPKAKTRHDIENIGIIMAFCVEAILIKCKELKNAER